MGDVFSGITGCRRGSWSSKSGWCGVNDYVNDEYHKRLRMVIHGDSGLKKIPGDYFVKVCRLENTCSVFI